MTIMLDGYREYGDFSEAIQTSTSGDNTILAAQGAGIIIVPTGYWFMANGAVNVKWKSGAGTDKTGLHYFAAAGSGLTVPEAVRGLFKTAANEALVLNLSGAVAVGGLVWGKIFKVIA